MLKPKHLSEGDTVALVNPAGMPPERFRHYLPCMQDYLQSEGFLTKTYYAAERASPEDLARTFEAAWSDERVMAVFPVCGSELIWEVLRHLDPEVLRRRSVILAGSSLLSALSAWISQQTEVVTFFGPHLPFLQKKSPQRENEFTVQSFWGMVMWKVGRKKRIATVHEQHHFFRVESHLESVLLTNIYQKSDLITDARRRDVQFVSLFQGKVSGKSLCVTLGALVEMVRRGMLRSLEGHILFTETMDWRFEQVEEAFKEILGDPSLRGLRGVFVTALTERTDRKVKLFSELKEKERLKKLCERISTLANAPTVYGFPLGHCAYKLTLPQGIGCEVDLEQGSVLLKERPVI